jgi:hypothetical protein
MNVHQAMIGALPAWKSVKLGALASADAYRKALASGAAPKLSWIEEIVGNPAFSCASSETELELVAPTVEELGFPDGGLDSKVRAKAIALGLKPCPVEALAALQLSARDTGERVIIATDAIHGASGDLVGFDVTFGQAGLRLNGDCGPVDRLREPNVRVAFVRPK